jgi:hypothetical protein
MDLKPAVEFINEGDKVSFQSIHPGAQLDDIEPPGPAFYFADRRLASPNTKRQVALAQLERLPSAAQQLQEDIVVSAVNGLQHGGVR